MSTNQAHYVQNWTLGALAANWLKVRAAEPGGNDEGTRELFEINLFARALMPHDFGPLKLLRTARRKKKSA